MNGDTLTTAIVNPQPSPEKLKQLNDFFVKSFNYILQGEELSLAANGVTNLSVKEVHVIVAVSELKKTNNNTMSRIAEELNVTAGALTTAVNTLVRKEYLTRMYDLTDRRTVRVQVTEEGEEVITKHDEFHDLLIEFVSQRLSSQELDLLTHSLAQITSLIETFIHTRKDSK